MSKCALLTMSYNEPDFLRMFYQYYSQHFDDCDIYVLEDGNDPGYLDCIGAANCVSVGEVGQGFNGDTKIRVNRSDYTNKLLGSYEYVLSVDTDEFCVPDPEKWPGGLRQYIEEFEDVFAQCSGYNILDTTGEPLDTSLRPWLAQRRHWHRDWGHYCKVTLVSTDPWWGGGFHNSRWTSQWSEPIGPHERTDFRLLHMHYVCKVITKRRYEHRKCTNPANYNVDNAIASVEGYANSDRFTREEIPKEWRLAL